jgi:hypothetical protein
MEEGVSAQGVVKARRKIATRLAKPTDDDRVVYPWASMVVGGPGFTAIGGRKNNVQICAKAYGRNHGMKFGVRAVPEGVQVWRIW